MIQIILLIIAYVLSSFLLIIGVVMTLILFLTKPKTFYTNFCNWSGDIAISLDRFGNAVLQFPLNKWFIRVEGYQFGNISQTLSGVFGVNKIQGHLRPAGRVVCWLLDKVQKNHVENAAKKILDIKKEY